MLSTCRNISDKKEVKREKISVSKTGVKTKGMYD